MRTESALRKEMLRIGHLLYERNLLVALDGNLSVRISDTEILCTKAGCHKGLLTDDDLVVIDVDGNLLRGAGRPTSEMAMHLACYQNRPDVQAVVHAHPPICVAFTVAGLSLEPAILPEVVLTLGAIPTLPYRTTGTDVLALQVGSAMALRDAVLLERHGAVCVGTSLLEAFCRLEVMEHTARIVMHARSLGAVQTLDPEEAIALRSMGLKRYGGAPHAVALADEPTADLPPVSTTKLSQPDVLRDPYENRLRLTQPHSIHHSIDGGQTDNVK